MGGWGLKGGWWGGWSLLLPVIARICARAHSRSMSLIRFRACGSALFIALAFSIARVAILSASSLPGILMCERT